jgi:hypothetical protein
MKSHRNIEMHRRFYDFVALPIFVTCGAALLFWPSAPARAQAQPGPLPAHDPTDAPPPKAPAQASPETTKPNLAGTWKMNKDQSDDPRKAMQQAGGNSGGRGGWGGMGRGGGMGGGGHHGGYGGQRGGQNSENTMSDYKELTIEQSKDYLKIKGSSGHILAQTSESDQSGSNSSSEASASAPTGDWQGTKFVVVTQSEHGSKTTRTFELSQDGKQLYLSTRIDNQ